MGLIMNYKNIFHKNMKKTNIKPEIQYCRTDVVYTLTGK